MTSVVTFDININTVAISASNKSTFLILRVKGLNYNTTGFLTSSADNYNLIC